MLGSLCLRNGVLYVGRHALTAHVRPYDLDGRPLGPGFSFRARDGGRAEASGIAVDEDRRVWAADRASGTVRVFTVAGLELDGNLPNATSRGDHPGGLAGAVDIDTDGAEDEARVLVSCGGVREHALHLFDLRSGRVLSLRSRGVPGGTFTGLAGVALRGPTAWACDPVAGHVQVFRHGEFHYLLRLAPSPGSGARFEPRAIAPLSDGRALVVQGGSESGALLLFDASGRLLRAVAEPGPEDGQLLDPWDVAVEEGPSDRSTRVAVIDRDGERVQVFTLEGRCLGEFPDLGWTPPQTRRPGRKGRAGNP